jgi:hypothetical protein
MRLTLDSFGTIPGSAYHSRVAWLASVVAVAIALAASNASAQREPTPAVEGTPIVQLGVGSLLEPAWAGRDAYLRPAPGRVPLDVRSTGREQVIGTFVASLAPEGQGFAEPVRQQICMTPCRLYVPPGLFSIFANGVGLDEGRADLNVPATGMVARMRSANAGMQGLGAALGVLGITASVAGGIGAVYGAGMAANGFYPGEASTGHVGWYLLATAGALTFIGGGVLAAAGIWMSFRYAPGLDRTQTTPASPSLTLGFAPTPGGAIGGATARF